MATYEDNNLPEELSQQTILPAELFNQAHSAFTQALDSGEILAQEARAAYAYERKGSLNHDGFGDHRNASYSSDTNDIILQLTIRIPNPKTIPGEALDQTAALEAATDRFELEAERARLETEIAQAEAGAERAEAAARQKREKLEELRKK